MNTDHELVDATLAGDKSAFGALVLRHQTQVYRLVYRIIDNQSSAPDIVQEALLKAYQNLKNLRDKDRFSMWLFRIARNQCISWNRRYQQRVQETLVSVQDEIDNSRLHLPPAPDEILIEGELHKQVMKAVARLPEHSREAIEMFYFDGKSYSEIQSELGITKGTLGRLLHEARSRLRESLQAFCQMAVLWMPGVLNRLPRLTSDKPGMAANAATASTMKYLVISMLIHLTLFAGMSATELHWGVPDGVGNRLNHDVSIETSLLKIRVSAPDIPSSIQLGKLKLHQNTGKAPARDPVPKRPLSALALPNRLKRPALIASPMLVQEPKPISALSNFHANHPLDNAINLAAELYHRRNQYYSVSNVLSFARGAISFTGTYMQQTASPDVHISRLGILSAPYRGSEVTLGIDFAPPVSDDIRDAIISETEPSDDKNPPSELHDQLYQYSKTVRNLQEALNGIIRGRIIRQYNASELQAMAVGSRFSAVVVSSCDLEVLKALAASGLIPVVVTRSPVGQKHIRAIAGYDDSNERITLLDPMYYAKQRFSYSEFSSQWDDPQDACLLIFSHPVVPEAIRLSLTRYLPIEKIDSILIKVPRRR